MRLILVMILTFSSEHGWAMTLNQLIHASLKGDTELKVKRIEVDNAEVMAEIKSSWPDPMISTTRFVEPIQTRTGPQKGNVSMQFSLPWFPYYYLQGQTAESERQQKSSEYSLRQIQIAREVRKKANFLLAIDKKLKLFNELRSFTNDMLQINMARLSSQTSGQIDIATFSILVGRMDDKILTLKSMRSKVERQLSDLTGQNAEILKKLRHEFVTETQTKSLLSKLKIAKNHPLLASLRSQVRSSGLGLRAAKQRFVPDINVSVTQFEIEGAEGSEAKPLAYMVGLRVPIGYSKHQGRIESAAVTKSKSELRLVQSERELANLLIELKDKYRHLSENIGNYSQVIIPQAESAVNVSQRKFQENKKKVEDIVFHIRNLLELKLRRVELSQQLSDIFADSKYLTGEVY